MEAADVVHKPHPADGGDPAPGSERLRIRDSNVVDLMTLQPHEEHPKGLNNANFGALFTTDKPVIFAFHGYLWLIHRLCYRRTSHYNLHLGGYVE
jgi:xylulose-5-phosphate/fructose-6-phosphate phosphoketolase